MDVVAYVNSITLGDVAVIAGSLLTILNLFFFFDNQFFGKRREYDKQREKEDMRRDREISNIMEVSNQLLSVVDKMGDTTNDMSSTMMLLARVIITMYEEMSHEGIVNGETAKQVAILKDIVYSADRHKA